MSFRNVALCAILISGVSQPALAQSLKGTLEQAYANNSSLLAARADTRIADEGVSQALSGWRPTVSASATATRQWTDTGAGNAAGTSSQTVGLTGSQTLFRGFRTQNSTRHADANVLAVRANLEVTEQQILEQAAQAFMNVLRDQAIHELRIQNVAFLREQVRAANDRFSVGESTRTDVAQADARLASAVSLVHAAKSSLTSSKALYQQVTGEKSRGLTSGYVVDRLSPKTIQAAIELALREHPSIVAALHQMDAAEYNVKVVKGGFLPTITVEGAANRTWSNGGRSYKNLGSITGRVNIPLYQAGLVSSKVRQAKEQLGQSRIRVDVARDQVRASVWSAWGALDAARAQIIAAQSGVRAASLALAGVVEEQKVGQRTVLDVLDAQNELIGARITLVSAQRDRIVASFSMAKSVGQLSSDDLGLAVTKYNPQEHYAEVRDKWFGLRISDE